MYVHNFYIYHTMKFFLRLDKNNCLVPVPYGPESRVGQSGKYLIFNKFFFKSHQLMTTHKKVQTLEA